MNIILYTYYYQNITIIYIMEIITKEQYNELKKIDKTVEIFSLNKKIFIGKVVDVYDGDTCKIVINLKNEFVKFNVRMLGYDSPEIRTKNDIEKNFAKISKNILETLILNKIVKICCSDFDKYGRLLGSIITIISTGHEINVNEFMVDNHFGYSYFGDKKKEFNELLEYYKDIKIIDIETIDYVIDFKNYYEISLSNDSIITNNNIDVIDNKKNNNCNCLIL